MDEHNCNIEKWNMTPYTVHHNPKTQVEKTPNNNIACACDLDRELRTKKRHLCLSILLGSTVCVDSRFLMTDDFTRVSSLFSCHGPGWHLSSKQNNPKKEQRMNCRANRYMSVQSTIINFDIAIARPSLATPRLAYAIQRLFVRPPP